jgi:hypothetical protein
MKKTIFSFRILTTLLLILVSAVACSKKTSEERTGTAMNTANTLNESSPKMDYAALITTLTEKNIEAIAEETPKEVVKKATLETVKKIEKPTVSIVQQKPVSETTKVETPPATPTSKTMTTITAPTVNSKTIEKLEEKPEKPFSHAIWNDLLQKHVSAAGKVNYVGFKQDKAKLQSYLDLLAANEPSAKSKNDQIAYWINAYNAFTIDLILDNYPITSILKLDNGKTWHVQRITIGGKKYSLDDIEKKILIGKFKEPRVHFAVNCAAKSCPPLKNKAWEGSSLNADLDRAAMNFVNNTAYNKIDQKTAALSQIFNWYKGDFGDVNAFINKYANQQITAKTKVSYNEYNWDLNN